MDSVILKACTNKVGSTSQTEIGLTQEEWRELSEKQQDDVIQEVMWNIIEVWVEGD